MPRGGKTRTSGQGRPKGVPNKVTKDLREAWAEAVAHVNAHPTSNLKSWGEANPDKFWPLTPRILPSIVDITSGGQPLKPSHVTIALVEPDAERPDA